MGGLSQKNRRVWDHDFHEDLDPAPAALLLKISHVLHCKHVWKTDIFIHFPDLYRAGNPGLNPHPITCHWLITGTITPHNMVEQWLTHTCDA